MERAGASGDRPTAVAAFAPPVPGAGVAAAIAREVLDGFDRHYRLFRESSRAARARFEAALPLEPLQPGRDAGVEHCPSEILAARCAEYLEEPPPADWNGVYVMKSK